MWQSHLFGESLSKIITGASLSRRPNAATQSDLRSDDRPKNLSHSQADPGALAQ